MRERGACLEEARRILREKHITGMSEKQVAIEIFAHARVYYLCTALERFHLHFRFIKGRANPVDLEDGGDKPLRRMCYTIAWYLPGFSRKK